MLGRLGLSFCQACMTSWLRCEARLAEEAPFVALVCSHKDWGWGPIVDLVEHQGVLETAISEKDFPAVSNSRPFNDMSLHLFTKPLQPRPVG